MDLILRPWRHFADFEGRSRRAEYLLFHVVLWLVICALCAAGGFLSGSMRSPDDVSPAAAAFIGGAVILYFVSIIPAWSVAIRRIHDFDQSGWMALLFFVPLVNIVFLLILLCMPGTEGENSYGEDPREEDSDALQRPRGRDRDLTGPRRAATVTRTDI